MIAELAALAATEDRDYALARAALDITDAVAEARYALDAANVTVFDAIELFAAARANLAVSSTRAALAARALRAAQTAMAAFNAARDAVENETRAAAKVAPAATAQSTRAAASPPEGASRR